MAESRGGLQAAAAGGHPGQDRSDGTDPGMVRDSSVPMENGAGEPSRRMVSFCGNTSGRPLFLDGVPADAISMAGGGAFAYIRLPIGKGSGDSIEFRVGAGDILPASDGASKELPGCKRVAFRPGVRVAVAYNSADGGKPRRIGTLEELAGIWDRGRGADVAEQEPDVWLEGVYPEIIRKANSYFAQVAVPDPESAPVRGRTKGYGSFLVPLGYIRDRADGRKDVCLGGAG